MDKRETAKRYGLFILGLFFAALGVAFTKRGDLGVSPISSVANVLSIRFPALTLGTWLIIWNCCLILGQVLILRRKFQPIQLLQVPLSFLFGWFTDFGMWIVSWIPVNAYPMRLVMVFIGVLILGFGIALSVIANVVMNSGEAFVKAVSDTLRREFGHVKIAFDVLCVLFSLLLSLVFFHGAIVGAREGTVLSALLTGVAVQFYTKRLKRPLDSFLCK